MGVVKAWLRDDVETPEWAERATTADPVHVDVQGDPVPAVQTTITHLLTVRRRARTGFDDDGVPLFSWADVVTGPALVHEQREEFDADAGMTRVKARVVLLYEGDEQVNEAASVVSEDGTRWRVLAVRQTPDRLDLDLQRIAS